VGAAIVGVAGVVAAIFAVIGPIGGDDSGPSGPRGHISSPTAGQRISREFAVQGTLGDIPRDQHVWVAVQVKNLLFPKEPEIPAGDSEWVQHVVEGGAPPGGRISLVLLRVDGLGQQTIQRWLVQVRRGRGAPGLATIPGSVRLDVVDDLVVR
jgi:hypothetical protein